MNKFLKGALASLGAVLLSTSGITLAANGSEAQASGLQMSVVQTATGSGSTREITWTVQITDSQGRDFITTGTPTSNQILIQRSSSRACESIPVAFSVNSLNSGSCNSYFTKELRLIPARVSTSSGQITYDIRSSDDAFTTVAGYDAILASTRPYGALVAYLSFSTDANPGLNWNLYGSTGAWTPSAVAGISTVAGVGGSSPATSATSDMDPGVAFSGFLIAGATGRNVTEGTAGALRLVGKRLHLVHSATIGGIDVTVTSGGRSAVELTFDSLPAGKHDVVLKTKAGSVTTLRGFVTVN